MILVDSTVWIDYLNGVVTAQSEALDGVVRRERIATGDLIVAEVLRGVDRDRDFDKVLQMFKEVEIIEIAGREIAVQAARNFRALRKLGIEVRKTIDCLIATRCILDGHRLLHSDRDFDPFERYLGLRVVKPTQ